MAMDQRDEELRRREFLREVCGAASLAAGAVAATGAAAAAAGPLAAEEPAPASPLPAIRLGKFTVTRLILGGNPIGGYSHSTPAMAREMVDWFTHERTVEFIQKIEREGINTWQFDHFPKIVKALQEAREKGSKIQFICLHVDSESRGDLKSVVKDMDPIAIVHHGQVTDRSFREGKPEAVRDFVKRVKDLGVLAGVSTHMPENLKRMADEGWENDLFMTSFYKVTLPAEEQKKRYGRSTVHDPFYAEDPDEMTRMIREVEKPCLSFKVLAAGRKCWSDADVEASFRYAYQGIKKTDAVIVGFFPKHQDEVRADAGYARKYAVV